MNGQCVSTRAPGIEAELLVLRSHRMWAGRAPPSCDRRTSGGCSLPARRHTRPGGGGGGGLPVLLLSCAAGGTDRWCPRPDQLLPGVEGDLLPGPGCRDPGPQLCGGSEGVGCGGRAEEGRSIASARRGPGAGMRLPKQEVSGEGAGQESRGQRGGRDSSGTRLGRPGSALTVCTPPEAGLVWSPRGGEGRGWPRSLAAV